MPCSEEANLLWQTQYIAEIVDITTSPGSAQHTVKNAYFVTNLIISLEHVAVNGLLSNRRAYLPALEAFQQPVKRCMRLNEATTKPPAEESQDLFIESSKSMA